MSFSETALEDVLNHIKQALKQHSKSGMPIYVDPIGLSEADKTMSSTVTIDIINKPLKATLPRVLGQLDLAYCVSDGVLFITSNESIEIERKNAMRIIAGDNSPDTKATLELLQKPIPMLFRDETPLGELIEYVKKATSKDNKSPGIEIFPDPTALSEADKLMTSTVRGLELEGVPLKTTLRHLLQQLDLAYIVKDGILNIYHPEEPADEPEKQQEADRLE